MKSSKRILAAVLAVLLVLSVFPSVRASEDEKTTADGLVYRLITNDGDTPYVEITGYTGTAPDLIVPEQIQNLPVKSIKGRAFEACTMLKTVTISDSVTRMGYSVFEDCTNLVRVVLPKNLTYLDYTFVGCTNLTEVVFPTALEDIGQNIFQNCSSLTSLTLPENVNYISSHAFQDIPNLKEVFLPDAVEYIGGAAFSDCSSLVSLRIPKNVKTIGSYICLGCNSLTEIQVDAENEYFTSFGGTLYNRNMTHLIQAPGGFSGVFTVPDGVTTIEEGAFRKMRKLTEVRLPDSVSTIEEWAFAYTENLEKINLPSNLTELTERVLCGCEKLGEIQLPWTLTKIGEYALIGCDSLTELDIPTSVSYIGDAAFYNCEALGAVTFLGDAPWIEYDAFERVSAVCYYSTGYDGWDDSTLWDYSGNLTWVPDKDIHVHDYDVQITPPGCLEWGYTTYTCDCGYRYTGDEEFFTGHTMGEWTVHTEATCAQLGEERSSCENCDYYESRRIDRLEHSFSGGICQGCGCDPESAVEIVDVTQYSYTITPILSPFAYYLYVQTDNPDPRSFRLVDRNSAYYSEGDHTKIRIPTSYGYTSVDVDPGTYYISQQLYPDVVYEDPSIHRVPGGYIFRGAEAYSDGGEFVLLQQTVAGANIQKDKFRETDVTISCQTLYTRNPYLMEFVVEPEADFFDNLDHIQNFLSRYSVYPRGVYNSDKPKEGRRYPLNAVSYWYGTLDPRYTIFEELDGGLLMQEAYPFILDSLGFPGTIGAMAELLEPNCIVDVEGLQHYNVRVTLDGRSEIYGGAGGGGNDPLYSSHVERVFSFDGSSDCALQGTLDSHCTKLLSYEEVTAADNARYLDMVEGETYRKTIRQIDSTWALVAMEGGFGYSDSFAYLSWNGSRVRCLSDVWVDGRYVGKRSTVVLRATFEEHPTADIFLRDVTFVDYYGHTITKDVLYEYDADVDQWEASMPYYTGGFSTGGITYPDELILTREEVDAMNLDCNASSWPETGLIYNGTACPGTPFAFAGVTGVTLTEEITLTEGEEAQLIWQVLPENANDPRVEWETSDDTVVKIANSTTGLIRALKTGSAVVTVTTIDGAYSAECLVTVKDACENGHSFTNYVSDGNATCTEDGTKTAVCDRCDATSTRPDEGSALGHRFYESTVIPATCTEDGLESGICWRCEQECEQVIPAYGHEERTLIGYAPTCTETGMTDGVICNRCDLIITEQTELPASGHALGEWYVTKNPTCQNSGMEQRDCAACYHTETREIPALEHDYTETITPPTCTERGILLKICRRCGSEVMEYIPPAGHNHSAAVTEPTCTEGGYTTYTCACGDTYIADETASLGHDYADGYCVRCGEKYRFNPFADVAGDAFYYEPVLWAVENGITTGTSETTFSPNNACMRAHVVTFLWRAAGFPEPAGTGNPFADVKETDFFYEPVLWAVENGITNGTSASTFGSYDNCNRAAVVTFLWRASGSPEPTSDDNPFTDVRESDFFYKPVLWAVENGITNGVSETAFGPYAVCNRAQVVTFLYRVFN